MAATFTLTVTKGDGIVQFTYTNGNAQTDILTISFLGGVTAYTNALNAQNQSSNQWGTRYIQFLISDTRNILDINNGFLYFNNVSPDSASGNNTVYINSKKLANSTQTDRVDIIMAEKDISAITGIVGTISGNKNGPNTPYSQTLTIYQSYIDNKKEKRSDMEPRDINSLMTNAKGEMYIQISRSTNNIINEESVPVPLPWCIFGLNDFDNGYATLMQQQLVNLLNAMNS